MGNRLSKIYTRTGDDGSTGLGDGSRIAKNASRVEAYGTVDELNSFIGVVMAQQLPTDINELFAGIQQKLFNLGGELCIPGTMVLTGEDVAELEQALDSFNESLPPLQDFIMPGGNPLAAACHTARTVCRRAERRVVSLAAEAEVNEQSLQYLNRLSDLLFVIARVLNRADQNDEVLWTGSNRANNE